MKRPNRQTGVIIASHQRAEHITTHKVLRRGGYTGPIVILLDSGDTQFSLYDKLYPGEVQTFDKERVWETSDTMDNFHKPNSVLYARRASWEVAKRNGFTHFLSLDDDLKDIHHTFAVGAEFLRKSARVKCLDEFFELAFDFMDAAPVDGLSLSKVLGFHGGPSAPDVAHGVRCGREMAQIFMLRTDKPVDFTGTMRQDTIASLLLATTGSIFIALHTGKLIVADSRLPGGLTNLYDWIGAYRRLFYPLLCLPSSTFIKESKGELATRYSWNAILPRIVPSGLKRVGV